MSKRVLVTGSSRGIGRAIAMRLAQDGWMVAVHCVTDTAAARSTAEALGSNSAGFYQADLSDPGNVLSLWPDVLRDGPIHALVNNAGIYRQLQFADAGDQEFEANLRHSMAVNFESPLRLCRSAVEHFKTLGGGKIVNVASRVGFKGESGASMYAASKAALINLTRSLAVELSPQNVQLFGIAPGWVETAMSREGMETRLPEILKDIPLKRMAKPEDCAAAVAFLLRDEASYLSGITIDINGASYFH